MKYLLSLCLLLLSSVSFASENLVVVVPKNSAITSLNNVDVANIFLARTNRFPNGDKSVPLELKTGELRTDFYKNISGKTPRQLMSYWTTLVFTGKGRPPKSYSNYEELKQKFANVHGAITYVDISQVTEEMRIVYKFP